MVELFAVPHLTGSPDVSGPVTVVSNDELPTPAKLSGPLRPRIPWTGFSPVLKRHGLVSRYALGSILPTRVFSVAQADPSPERIKSLKQKGIIERTLSDRMSGLLFKKKSTSFLQDYSGKPPSSRTSTSRCIRLYAHNTP